MAQRALYLEMRRGLTPQNDLVEHARVELAEPPGTDPEIAPVARGGLVHIRKDYGDVVKPQDAEFLRFRHVALSPLPSNVTPASSMALRCPVSIRPFSADPASSPPHSTSAGARCQPGLRERAGAHAFGAGRRAVGSERRQHDRWTA
jgi:hypothetical protein